MTLPTTLTYPSNLPSNLSSVQVVDLRPVLPTNPKYTWESLNGFRNLNDLTTIVFHHDALSKASTRGYDNRTLATRIAQSHINTKKNRADGDAGFPYHAWIRNGVIHITNNLEALTYGVASNNGYTVHICVSGDYANHDTLTDQDRNALYAAYFLFKQWLPKYRQLMGHKELSPTACPGYDMAKVRKDISSIELEMSLNNTPNTALARIFGFHTRYQDLYNKAVNAKDPNQVAAQAKLLDIIQVAIDKGYYVPQ